jgi:hypothetical protein
MRVVVLAATTLLFGQGGAPRNSETFSLRAGTLELEARIEPLTDMVHGLERNHPEIVVSAPCVARDRYDVDHFRRLLPPHGVEVGEIWPIDPKALLPFLRQVIPGATDELHHGPVGAPGAFACLRFASEETAEIVLRAHVEFRYQAGHPATDVWLTPSQFRGRLGIDRRAGTVRAFELLVPDARANVDVNVRVEEMMIADIGRIPCLELRSGELPDDGDHGGLSLAQAEARLARRFYAAAELEWLELPAALARARASGKPLHVLTMFGSLFDESC